MTQGYEENFQDFETEINWDEVGGIVPKGRYDAELVQADYQPTAAGKHTLKVRWKIGGVHDSATEAAVNKMVFDNWVFTQEGAFKVKDFGKASGIDLPRTISKAILEEWCATILGTQITIDVDHRMWQGEPRSDLKKYHPLGGPIEAQPEQPEAPPPQHAKNGHANGTSKAGVSKGAKPATKAGAKPAARR